MTTKNSHHFLVEDELHPEGRVGGIKWKENVRKSDERSDPIFQMKLWIRWLCLVLQWLTQTCLKQQELSLTVCSTGSKRFGTLHEGAVAEITCRFCVYLMTVLWCFRQPDRTRPIVFAILPVVRILCNIFWLAPTSHTPIENPIYYYSDSVMFTFSAIEQEKRKSSCQISAGNSIWSDLE